MSCHQVLQRAYPTHVPLLPGGKVEGFVMAEQSASKDYLKRNAEFIEKAEISVLDDVLAIIDAIIF